MIQSISQLLMTGGVSGKNGQGLESAQTSPEREDIFAQLMQEAKSGDDTDDESAAIMAALFAAAPAVAVDPVGLKELSGYGYTLAQGPTTSGTPGLNTASIDAKALFGNALAFNPADMASLSATDPRLTAAKTALPAAPEIQLGDAKAALGTEVGKLMELAKTSQPQPQPQVIAREIIGQPITPLANADVTQTMKAAVQAPPASIVELNANSQATGETVQITATLPESVVLRDELGSEPLNARAEGLTPASSLASPPSALSSSSTDQPLQAQIRTAFGSEQWAAEMRGQLVRAALQGENQIALHLNPRELGPLMVELKMVENQAHLQFVSSHQNVRNAVEQAIPLLREMLSEQGIALGDSSVSQGSQQQQQDGLPQRGGPITEIQQDDSLAHVTPAADLRQTGQADGKINIYI